MSNKVERPVANEQISKRTPTFLNKTTDKVS